MAEKKEEKEGGDQAAAGGGKKKLIIIVVALLVLVGGGVGAFLAMGKSGGGEEDGGEGDAGEDEHGEEGEHEGELAPAVLPLDPFIVNLQVKGSFLKATIQLEFQEPELPPTIEHDTPKIRDAIITVLSNKAAPEILSADGKERLREELRRAVNETLHSEDVTKVYFTEFIIQ